jgi:hypothetical protein
MRTSSPVIPLLRVLERGTLVDDATVVSGTGDVVDGAVVVDSISTTGSIASSSLESGEPATTPTATTAAKIEAAAAAGIQRFTGGDDR